MDPIAPIGSAAATRPLPLFGDGGLTVGQVVHARVTRVEGDLVQLRWDDQTVSVASKVPLSVGQQVNLMVEESSSGKMLLRMVDDAFAGRLRQARPESPGTGRGTSTTTTGTAPGGRQIPVTGVEGGAERDASGPHDGRSFEGGDPDWSGAGGPGARTGTWAPGLPVDSPVSSGADPLAALLFEKLDGSGTRLAGSGRVRVFNLTSGSPPLRFAFAARTPVEATPPAHVHVARAAIPVYGRLAQSVGGAVAFGQLMAALPREIGETLARAPLAPADLGRLLIDVGVHPDEMNAGLVGEMLAQQVPVQEAAVRAVRRELAAAGGTPRDAAPAVTLSRLGLPITPLSLAVARQMLAGQLDPPAAWGELLPELQRLARFAGHESQAGALAAELLADWQVPVSDGPEAVGQWLRATVDQAGTPLEAKLAHPLLAGAERSVAASPGQDVRARLDLLGQSLATAGRDDRDALAPSLQRLQATVQAEQLLNGSSGDRAEPRFFVVTLPTILQHQASTLQIRVRERDARPRGHGEAARPDIVQLKLSLPGLGELGVNLTVGQHSVACHFAAGSAFAEALLTASAGELVGRLKRLGYASPAVDAAHEPPGTVESPLAAAPRVSHVDVTA